MTRAKSLSELDSAAAASDGVPEVAELEITEELDLHHFLPRDCADLVAEYVRAAREAGLSAVRIVHGKGTGAMRRIVQGALEKHPDVDGFQLADERAGSWGATIVSLKPRA